MLCELHDYIEIACTFRLPIALIMAPGEELRGVAIDTLVKPDKTEYVMFIEEGTEEAIALPMNKLIKMNALTKNVHFDTVNFQ